MIVMRFSDNRIIIWSMSSSYYNVRMSFSWLSSIIKDIIRNTGFSAHNCVIVLGYSARNHEIFHGLLKRCYTLFLQGILRIVNIIRNFTFLDFAKCHPLSLLFLMFQISIRGLWNKHHWVIRLSNITVPCRIIFKWES